MTLSARGLKVSKKADKRIREETDGATVERWITLALRCESVDELLKG